MSNGKAWYTTENIGTWYGIESDKIDLSYAKREISLKDSIRQTMNLKNRCWLSSEAAGELADKLEAQLEDCGAGGGYECCDHAHSTLLEVIKVLRGAGK